MEVQDDAFVLSARAHGDTGAVVDLKIEPGRVTARVAGTRLYQVQIGIRPIATAHWRKLVRASTGPPGGHAPVP